MKVFDTAKNIEILPVPSDVLSLGTCSLSILREDTIHDQISGNKFRKLKYNCIQAIQEKKQTLITFGGAYSNHIAASAYAANAMGLSSVGIIRGEELKDKVGLNPTLSWAQQHGMKFQFVSREAYRAKGSQDFLTQLKNSYPKAYILPEGGSNALAVKGCAEMLSDRTHPYTHICVAVGTGATMAGLIKASGLHQQIIGFSALKGTFQQNDFIKYTSKSNYQLIDSYNFGGYAKIDNVLIRFMNEFKSTTGVLLDPVYTAKMMFGILDLINQNYFPKNSRILAVHTGGLQGIKGMNQKLIRKNLPQINT